MKPLGSAVAIVALWAAVTFGELRPAQVAGVVRSAATGEALKSAAVVLRSRQPEQKVFRATTGVDGRFGFPEVPPGQYQLTISKSGYHTFHGETALLVSEGAEVTGLALSLWPHGAVSGHVIDWEGEPVARAEVRAYAVAYGAAGASLRLAAEADSDDVGEYRLFDLPAGPYVVQVSPPRDNTPAGQFYSGAPVVYYPSAPSPAQAAPLTLSPGEEVTRADVTISHGPSFSIAGAVRDISAEGPLRRCLVQVLQLDGPYRVAVPQTAAVSPGGAFTLSGLSSGDYLVVARQGGAAAQTRVSVRGRHVRDALLVIGLQQTVTGQIVLENAPEGIGVTEWVPRLLPVALPEWWPPADGNVDTGRRFVIDSVLPAQYRFEVRGLPPGAYLKTIRAGGQSLAAPEITVPSEGAISGLEAVIGFDAAAVRGKLRSSGSTGKDHFLEARVFLVPQAGQGGGYLLPKTAETAPDGSFNVVSVVPGSYTLYALPVGASLQIFDPAVQAALSRYATAVRLEPGANVEVEVTLASQTR